MPSEQFFQLRAKAIAKRRVHHAQYAKLGSHSAVFALPKDVYANMVNAYMAEHPELIDIAKQIFALENGETVWPNSEDGQ